jgi:uncharacterized RDD family membrane protein YckC
MSTLAPTDAIVPLYAGFWRRAAAALIDGIILFIPNVVLGIALGNRSGLAFLLSVVISCVYYAGLHSSSSQATWGKRTFGIKVTNTEGERIGFGRGIWRYFASFFSALILGIGYLMAAFTGRRQALHDMMAGTLVVNGQASAEDIASGGGVMPVTGGVIAVGIILFGLPFVVGILAAISIPAYQDYTVRAKVQEAIMTSRPLRNEIEQALLEKRPVTTGTFPSPSLHAKSLTAHPDGRMVIALAIPSLPEGTITFSPVLETTGTIQWKCQAAAVTNKYLPAACRSS